MEKEHSVPGEKTREMGWAMWVGLVNQIMWLGLHARKTELTHMKQRTTVPTTVVVYEP